jgi:hypothetical protein
MHQLAVGSEGSIHQLVVGFQLMYQLAVGFRLIHQLVVGFGVLMLGLAVMLTVQKNTIA